MATPRRDRLNGEALAPRRERRAHDFGPMAPQDSKAMGEKAHPTEAQRLAESATFVASAAAAALPGADRSQYAREHG